MGEINQICQCLNSFDGTSMDSEFTETPYFRFTTEDEVHEKMVGADEADLVSLRMRGGTNMGRRVE